MARKQTLGFLKKMMISKNSRQKVASVTLLGVACPTVPLNERQEFNGGMASVLAFVSALDVI